MLVVGMHGEGNVARGGCSDAEYRSHFSLWCLLAAPLMIGCDVRHMSPAAREILLNSEAIAVNQDPLGAQGWKVGEHRQLQSIAEIWAKPLADGSVALGLFNLGEKGHRRVPFAWESVGLHDRRPCRVRDLWAHEDLGVFRGEFSTLLDRHDVALLKLTPTPD
jgi:alpha-galactosidase